MHDVTEHNTEEEGERDASENSGISLFVVGHAVSVNDHLEYNRKFSFAEHRGVGQFVIDFTVFGVDVNADLLHGLDVRHEILFTVGGAPDQSH